MHDNHTQSPMESFVLLHGPTQVTQQCYVFSESVSQTKTLSAINAPLSFKLFLVECFANVFYDKKRWKNKKRLKT